MCHLFLGVLNADGPIIEAQFQNIKLVSPIPTWILLRMHRITIACFWPSYVLWEFFVQLRTYTAIRHNLGKEQVEEGIANNWGMITVTEKQENRGGKLIRKLAKESDCRI